MEVILPFIAMVTTLQTTELGELKTEVASLRRQLSDLQVTGKATAEATGESDPNHVLHRSLVGYVGTTDVSEILPGNAHLHAPSRETSEPAARDDERC